jgi:predicted secreted protein
MFRGMHRIARAGLLILVVASLGALSESSSSSSLVVSPGTVAVSVGGLAFEVGSALALEIVGSETSSCFTPPVLIRGLAVSNAAGQEILSQTCPPDTDATDWIGRVHLADEAGVPFPEGDYTVTVTTSVGRFSAGFSILQAGDLATRGHGTVRASVCGISLRVYRLLAAADAGQSVSLRVGDRLMVELAGNPTTGYTWDDSIQNEYAVLRPSEEPEYRADSALLGAGGTFLFRYLATDVGPQDFRFIYHRPWESVQPESVVSFSVNVY